MGRMVGEAGWTRAEHQTAPPFLANPDVSGTSTIPPRAVPWRHLDRIDWTDRSRSPQFAASEEPGEEPDEGEDPRGW